MVTISKDDNNKMIVIAYALVEAKYRVVSVVYGTSKQCVVHHPVTNINKNLYFTSIQLMMYIVFIIDNIHDLMNESKMLNFTYISDRRVYM